MFHQRGKIWANGAASEALEDHGPAAGPAEAAATARPQDIAPGFEQQSR
jgi:hypothetical protein